jgi:DNA-binding beta-propeller fold protein YncE
MASDISRKLFNRKKHYSGVISQQGRVTLDADLNEQLDIQLYRTHTETKDVIGYSGVPKKNGGFLIKVDNNAGLTIAPGRIYIGGLLCELEDAGKPVNYFNQPYYPDPDTTFLKENAAGSPPESPFSPPQSPASPPSSPLDGSHLDIADGVYIVYIDAWQREINYLDDPLIQEVALGEADTTARLQTVWQVKLLKVDVANLPEASCKTPFQEWKDLVTPVTGKLNARTNKDTTPNDPCSLKPGTGFRGLENQLYLVEIQKGDSAANASFKWSRDNATLETTIESISGSKMIVSSIGKDDIMSFATGQWVEIVDETSSLHNVPSPLVKITGVNPAIREITVNTSILQHIGKEGLKLRRWDQPNSTANENGIAITPGWIPIQDGVEIKFSDGTYHPGDYWLIPARTATGDIEWPPYTPGISPIAQAPAGIKHHFAQLALLKANDGLVTLEDCRELFPSLTEICAEDICFKNDNCVIGEADNVQEALDLLCAANDLRDHNKQLHGNGVVCGLKVVCGPNREFVFIENGYALDCEGNIIRLKKALGMSYNIVAEAATAGLLDDNGNGDVSISIGYKGKNEPSVSIEKYIQKSFWEEILEGSLIQDFVNEDIKPLIDFVKNQVTFPLTDTPPVPIGQQRLTALISLIWQSVNSASGPYIFLSGNQKRTTICNQKAEEKQNEDQLLFCLYQELKALIASETFCAMFDNDHPFPGYKIEPGLDTIFGPTLKAHNRLRLNLRGKLAYTCGKDNKIYVYDLSKLQLHQTLVFPSTANIKLQDIAVSSKGNELYATGLLDDKDSIIAVVSIDVASGKHTWVNGSSVKCAFKYVSLAFNEKFGLHAISKNKGLYRITGIGTAAFAETQLRAFNATGLIVIPDAQNIAYVANNATIATETNLFTQIDAIDLSSNAVAVSFVSAGDNTDDDILVFKDLLYVTGTSGAQRVLKSFVITSGAAFANIILEASSSLRLAGLQAGDREFVLIAMSDKYKVVRVEIKSQKLDAKFRIPVQLFPIGIVVTEKNDIAYVLNSIVNTLTAINVERTFSSPSPNYTEEPPFDIADYHDDVILAYKDLMSHLLQHLKDAFCGRFIIDCPQCNEKDRVYLGTVRIKGRRVYRICNFNKRRYVKTFRTWGYWLSTIPILPALKTSFAKFCCTVIDKKAP